MVDSQSICYYIPALKSSIKKPHHIKSAPLLVKLLTQMSKNILMETEQASGVKLVSNFADLVRCTGLNRFDFMPSE